jgi:hypothetical protein
MISFKKRTTHFINCVVIFLRGLDFAGFFGILLQLKLKNRFSMKEKILQQLKAALGGSDGKTSLSDQTFNAYSDFLAAQIGEESKIPDAIKPYVELLRVVQGNINHTAATSVSEKEAALKSEYEKQMSELKKQLPGKDPKPDDVEAKVTELLEAKIAPLKQEIETYKAREAGEKRDALIMAKAKELGIPQSRIEEGFAIAPDADEGKIVEYLAKVAKNAVAGVVETSKTGLFPPSTPLDQMKSEADAWAKTLADAKGVKG